MDKYVYILKDTFLALSSNWLYQVLLFVIAPLPVLIYEKVPLWIRDFRLRALDSFLKYGVNLGLFVFLSYFRGLYVVITMLSSIVLTVITGELQWLLLNISIPLLWVIIYIILRIIRKPKEGLVGLIASDFSRVSNVTLNKEEEFHLAYCNTSFEKRKPIFDSNEIEKKCEIISEYYVKLGKRIEDDDKVNHDLFLLETKDNKRIHICEYFRQLYCTSVISSHIAKVYKQMSEDNSINFIGDKIGVYGFQMDGKNLKLNAYMTDHFTWKVFKSIYQKEDVKNALKPMLCKINIASTKEQGYIISAFKYLFSSFGIDIIINGETADGKSGILVGLRNGGIETKGHCKLHVPVNESFSSTDLEEGDPNRYSIYQCVRRGIEEELGIFRNLISNECIHFYDFAIVTDEGEIGLGCQCDITNIMPLEQSRMYPGQDKFLELKDLIIIPKIPFLWDSRKYPQLLYKLTGKDEFCTPWESFTPLLYQRFVIRNKKWSPYLINLLDVITITLVTILLSSICYGYISAINATGIGLIVTVLAILAYFGYKIIERLKKKKYSFFQPLIVQWGADVTVIQNTARNIPDGENEILTNLTFGLTLNNKKERVEKFLPLQGIELVDPPYCNSRTQILFDNAECPIGFYHIRKAREFSKVEKQKLLFKVVPCISTSDGKFKIIFEVNIDEEEKVSYNFSLNIKDEDYPNLIFKSKASGDDLLRLSKLYSVNIDVIKSMCLYELSDDFKSMYRPLDLFYYKNNYYWSLDVKETQSNNVIKDLIKSHDRYIPIERNTDLYDVVKSKGIKETTQFVLEGTPTNLIMCLAHFMTNQQNLKRISPLDIYMLQLALIRQGDDEFVLAKKDTPWYSNIFKKKK